MWASSSTTRIVGHGQAPEEQRRRTIIRAFAQPFNPREELAQQVAGAVVGRADEANQLDLDDQLRQKLVDLVDLGHEAGPQLAQALDVLHPHGRAGQRPGRSSTAGSRAISSWRARAPRPDRRPAGQSTSSSSSMRVDTSASFAARRRTAFWSGSSGARGEPCTRASAASSEAVAGCAPANAAVPAAGEAAPALRAERQREPQRPQRQGEGGSPAGGSGGRAAGPTAAQATPTSA